MIFNIYKSPVIAAVKHKSIRALFNVQKKTLLPNYKQHLNIHMNLTKNYYASRCNNSIIVTL